MNNGLDINEEQFMRMASKDQRLVLFRNSVYNRKQFKDYKVHKKVQYVWLTVLTIINATYLGIKGWII